VQQFPGCHVTGLEFDVRQHAKNLAEPPQPDLVFWAAGAQAIPLTDASCDLALMLKSLHHLPLAAMATALGEVARVLRPGSYLYVSEPIFDGAMNEVVRHYNDEEVVRTAAQAAVDAALTTGFWEQVAERCFATPVHFEDFADFEQRMMRPIYADHQLDDATIAAVRSVFEPYCGASGADFTRPMRVRLLRRVTA